MHHQSTPLEPWLTSEGAAERLGITEAEVLHAWTDGTLRGVRIHKRLLRFRPEDVDAWDPAAQRDGTPIPDLPIYDEDDQTALLSVFRLAELLGLPSLEAEGILLDLGAPRRGLVRARWVVKLLKAGRQALSGSPVTVTRRQASRGMRRAVMARDGNICRYCGKKITQDRVEIDHVTPVIRGGANTLDNLVVACRRCNMRKHTKLLEELRWTLKPPPAINPE